MSQEIEESEQMLSAVELLTDLASTFQTIATNLHKNRLDRKPLQRLLHDYAARAESDGRLINASRQNPRCVSRGLFLAYTHMELLSWTANHNYTIMSTSVKWYSWRKVFARYRLPLFSVSTHTAELQSLMKNIERVAGMVASELEENNVSWDLPVGTTDLISVNIGVDSSYRYQISQSPGG